MSPLSNDVKLTYLKTLVTGKAKAVIADVAYCGAMYRDALRILERKFGQPQTVVTAHLDKRSSFPPLKIHNSDNKISYSLAISSLVGVFKPLNYKADLRSAPLLNMAVSKLPPNMKESWSLHTVRQFSSQPTLLNFKEWLSVKAEAHERMQSTAPKPKADESKTKTKVFVSTAEPKKASSPCLVCEGNHAIWNCAVFKQKTPTQRAHVAASNQLCFSCLKGSHGFRKCPKPRKCAHKDCNSSPWSGAGFSAQNVNNYQFIQEYERGDSRRTDFSINLRSICCRFEGSFTNCTSSNPGWR